MAENLKSYKVFNSVSKTNQKEILCTLGTN